MPSPKLAPLLPSDAERETLRALARKWRVQFMEHRMDGLADAPRPGARRKITAEQVKVLACGPPPDKHYAGRWSRRCPRHQERASRCHYQRQEKQDY